MSPDEGVKLLCNSLKVHPSIHTIWLGANQISDLGLKYLTELFGRERKRILYSILNIK